MKSNIVGIGLTSIFAVVLNVTLATSAHAEGPPCSPAQAAGNWAFTDGGTIIGVGLRDAVGTFTLDANGNVLNGQATSSLNGSIADETFSGTYSLNSDCAGSLKAHIFQSGTEIFVLTMNLAFDNHTNELRGIFTSVVVPNGPSLPTVITLQAKKQ